MMVAVTALLIVVLSAVQSTFGVGLLVFGTPLLLLLGHPFHETIAILLPCSITISALQVFEARSEIRIQRPFLFYCLPLVAIGLILHLLFENTFQIRGAVGVLLILTGLLRSSARLQARLRGWISRSLALWFAAIGFIHGISNLGGGPLAVLVSSVFDDNEKIRANIAFGYLWMAFIQILVLAAMRPGAFNALSLLLPPLAATTHFLLSRRRAVARPSLFAHALTTLIFAFGAVLMLT